MTFNEMLTIMQDEPDATFESESCGAFGQKAETILFWFFLDNSFGTEDRIKTRETFRFATDWQREGSDDF